ncbi:MAG: ornithine cyclodeaminase family protein [Gemmobacter sp.]|nr:ornithine cyclodeaminase family protein [Gemmobacter sp.]
MRVLSGEEVARLLPMDQAVEVIDRVMRVVSAGGAHLPLRNVVPVGGDNMMGVMPGALSEPGCFGVKLISLFPGNSDRGLSSHRGALVLFEPDTGGAVAMMDASLLTAIRTAAASAVATRTLARTDARTLTLIGTGEQAEHHLAAMRVVRAIDHVTVVGRSMASANRFAEAARTRHPGLAITATTDTAAAVAAADIVCTVTASATAVLQGAWVRPGTHLNIVGASVPSKREVDDDTVLASRVYVDYRPSALAQAGEIVDMIAAGRIDAGFLRGEIGAVLSGDIQGRSAADQITLYRSLGIAAQDLAAASHVLTAAQAQGLGQLVRL